MVSLVSSTFDDKSSLGSPLRHVVYPRFNGSTLGNFLPFPCGEYRGWAKTYHFFFNPTSPWFPLFTLLLTLQRYSTFEWCLLWLLFNNNNIYLFIQSLSHSQSFHKKGNPHTSELVQVQFPKPFHWNHIQLPDHKNYKAARHPYPSTPGHIVCTSLTYQIIFHLSLSLAHFLHFQKLKPFYSICSRTPLLYTFFNLPFLLTPFITAL